MDKEIIRCDFCLRYFWRRDGVLEIVKGVERVKCPGCVDIGERSEREKKYKNA